MKLGLILECASDGPDEKVLCCLLGKFAPEIECQTMSLTKKPDLVRDCGNTAKQLIGDGCERVVIVWDLYPAGFEDAHAQQDRVPCLHRDREKILASLTTAGVSQERVSLVAIKFMLESWLLADRQAIADFLSTELGTPIRKQQVRRHNPMQCPKPKDVLSKIFEQCGFRHYDGFSHAHKIAAEMRNLNEIRNCPTFRRFWEKATGQP